VTAARHRSGSVLPRPVKVLAFSTEPIGALPVRLSNWCRELIDANTDGRAPTSLLHLGRSAGGFWFPEGYEVAGFHAKGSSGGPMFVEGNVVGVVSGVESNLFGNYSDGSPIRAKIATLKLNKNLADQFLLKGAS
jgi:hypothetical protein